MSSWSTTNWLWCVESSCLPEKFVNLWNFGQKNSLQWLGTDLGTLKSNQWWGIFWASTMRLAARWLLLLKAVQNTHQLFNKRLNDLIWKQSRCPRRRNVEEGTRVKIRQHLKRLPLEELWPKAKKQMAKKTLTLTTSWPHQEVRCLATSWQASSSRPRRKSPSPMLSRGPKSDSTSK